MNQAKMIWFWFESWFIWFKSIVYRSEYTYIPIIIWIWLNSSVHERYPPQDSSLDDWFDSTSFWNWFDSIHDWIRFSKKWIDSSNDSTDYEKCDSIRFMIQAKIIWSWFDSWFKSESFTSLLVGHSSMSNTWSSICETDKVVSMGGITSFQYEFLILHSWKFHSDWCICKLQVLGQPVTAEVGSNAQKWPNPVYANNLASDGATAKKKRSVFLRSLTSLTSNDQVVPWPLGTMTSTHISAK